MNYKEALTILTRVLADKHITISEGEDVEALCKARQAVEDCLEMGLDGEGDGQ